MSPSVSVALLLCGGLIAAVAQVLLKKGANSTKRFGLDQYLNPFVVLGYALLLGTTVLSVVAYKGLSYKYGPPLGASSYVFVAVLSWMVFEERMSTQRICGTLLIVVGVSIFCLE